MQPRTDRLDSITDRSSDMFADLESIGSELEVVIDKCKNRCKGPDDTPDGDITELSDHFRIVGFWSVTFLHSTH